MWQSNTTGNNRYEQVYHATVTDEAKSPSMTKQPRYPLSVTKPAPAIFTLGVIVCVVAAVVVGLDAPRALFP